ncbi:hypothetical protein SDC9_148183 [bioreactor metagenome]|uniref:Uncharacterized protein n=1 Tax=bioreactor metagenome TaxID=1076179 RepID=A0A645EG19_9ZZZZ
MFFSTRCATNSKPKLRANCSTPLARLTAAISNAIFPRACRSGVAAVTTLKAFPTLTWVTAMKAALPNAPRVAISTNGHCSSVWESTQRTGERRSETKLEGRVNSAVFSDILNPQFNPSAFIQADYFRKIYKTSM